MNLTMNSTIIELSFHICNFVLEVLYREEPGARVWQKLMSKLQPKIAIFQKNQYIYLPSGITFVTIPLFTLVTQLSKSVEKNLAYRSLLNFCHKHSMPHVVLGSPEFSFSPALVNSQLVCPPPVGILNLVMFI